MCTMWRCQLLQQRNGGRSLREINQPKASQLMLFFPVSTVPDSADSCYSVYFNSSSLCITMCIRPPAPQSNTQLTPTNHFVLFSVLIFVLPTQLPWSSGVKPVMHLGFALQTKEPTLFSHAEPAAQLWVCEAHSSMSAKKAQVSTNSMVGWGRVGRAAGMERQANCAFYYFS